MSRLCSDWSRSWFCSNALDTHKKEIKNPLIGNLGFSRVNQSDSLIYTLYFDLDLTFIYHICNTRNNMKRPHHIIESNLVFIDLIV